MKSNQQFEQLILQYKQLRNGSDDIFHLIEAEDYDSAITMIKSRESIFLDCKCILKYLELTDEQRQEVDSILDEIRALEKRNIDFLTKSMADIKRSLKATQKTEKLQMAYGYDEAQTGGIVNITE